MADDRNNIKRSGGDLFIVDNSDTDWKVMQYLREWADIASKFDIATGYFEIGALLALDGQWQKLEQIRILMGDQVSMRTKRAMLQGIEKAKMILDDSLEKEKEVNDFLTGAPAIVSAIAKNQIQCRIYTKDKFHAKAYITHAKQAVIGSTALVGSSNFTYPGMTTNVELNIQIRREVEELQDWFERHWNEAEIISDQVLKVIERHVRDYSPFEVYTKALQEYFRGHEMTPEEWEHIGPTGGGSRMYPHLDRYQQEGYRALMKIARQYGGAFLCDGVGLGKTFIGLMLIERLVVKDRKRVALFVPKAARIPVWERKIEKYLPHLGGDFTNLVIFNHSDLSRGGEYPRRFDRIMDMADAIVIDEAHHFRNPGIKGEGSRAPSRYRRLYEIAESKTMFLLTATPVNNRLIDLQHMIELFSRVKTDYFKEAPLGIHSLRGHFRKMENALEALVASSGGDSGDSAIETNMAEAERVLYDDALFRALVVQRSRAYVKQSQLQHGESNAIFPTREDPTVVDYSIRKTYGTLLDLVEKAFSKDKPLLSLAIYYPLAYYRGPDDTIDPLQEGRQKQVVALIRTQFLKRFESSAKAFEMSCATLLIKLLTFLKKFSKTKREIGRLERWEAQNAEILKYIAKQYRDLIGIDDEELDEDALPDELTADFPEINREDYKIEDMLAETFLDLDQLAVFLQELKKFRPAHDDKLQALIRLMKNDTSLKRNKVLIFTEFMDTAKYLRKQLDSAEIDHVDEVDSSDERDRGEVLIRFAPYYNDSSSPELKQKGLDEIRVLISTDVLSEALNLQDATFLINYDLHWNPVRLMQRIGRVDRRMDPEVERRILKDHPKHKRLRGKVKYWNFLPPEELDRLLRLYAKVSKKTLRISKVFGIEGKKLLTPEDDYEALKDFLHSYEGTTSTIEAMHLEYQKLLNDYPGLEDKLSNLPRKIFSGKQHLTPGSKAVFFCFSLPAPEIKSHQEKPDEEIRWTEEAGHTRWYLYDMATEKITDDPAEIIDIIRSNPETQRRCIVEKKTLSEIRAKMEKHIKNTYFKQVQAPIGVKPTIKAWMELS